MTLRSPTGFPGRSTGFTTFLARILLLLLAASCHATIENEGGLICHKTSLRPRGLIEL